MRTLQVSLRRLIFLALLVLACVPALARSQDSVSLRPAARVEAGVPVTLGDIAELSGEAARLSSVVIVEATGAKSDSGIAVIDLAKVRAALEAERSVRSGRVAISGHACRVSFRSAAPMATGAAPGELAAPVLSAAAPVVRDLVVARIADQLQVTPDDLRLTFENTDAVLELPVLARTVAIQPAGRGDRLPIGIRVYEGDRIIASGNVRVAVLVRRQAPVSRVALQRAEEVTAERVQVEERWLPPSVMPASATSIIGATARARIDAGAVIEARDVEPALAVKKGNLVSVECVAGSVVVGATMRAMQSARDGETIDFQSLSSKKTVRARMNGPGRAVMVASDSEDQS
jgi:flagella basal body P-ring formation protein FlgA